MRLSALKDAAKTAVPCVPHAVQRPAKRRAVVCTAASRPCVVITCTQVDVAHAEGLRLLAEEVRRWLVTACHSSAGACQKCIHVTD